MCGGDEVSGIVIDLGSHTCKAGKDAPRLSINQMEVDDIASAEKNYGSSKEAQNNAKNLDSDKTKAKRKLYVGSQALGFSLDHMEVLSPLKDGIIADWELVNNDFYSIILKLIQNKITKRFLVSLLSFPLFNGICGWVLEVK
ncbi:hypothetical protein UlMin_033224 [Ulmus minor]